MAKVFISYSHKDENLRDELEKQLAMLNREGVIETWHDRRIIAGDSINTEIDARLQDSDVILLLVSPDFLNSSYCYEIEVATAMKLHETGKARVIPVILRPCDWRSPAVPFRDLLAVPRDGKAITRWPDRDEAMLDVVQQLRAAFPAAQVKPKQQQRFTANAVDRPRSSNLRVAREFTQADLDHFLDEAFEYMMIFFENSLDELKARHADIQARFRRIDADSFGCTVYRNGKSIARCGVRRSTDFGNGISYSSDDNAPRNTMNEQLTVASDDQAMWLRPMGMQMGWGMDRNSKLTPPGASEFYWSLLIEPLQRQP